MKNTNTIIVPVNHTCIIIPEDSLKVSYYEFCCFLLEMEIKQEEPTGLEDYTSIIMSDNKHLSQERWDKFFELLYEKCDKFDIRYSYEKHS